MVKVRAELITLERRATAIRTRLGLNSPGKLLLRKRMPSSAGRRVVAEADGMGGAWVSVVEGDYPLDYQLHYERYFAAEAVGVAVAKNVALGLARPRTVLQPSKICPPRTHVDTDGDMSAT